ncbi:MAG: 1-deoxy-D-xylulose-5-phosphate reductoisomerase [Dehalococcoidia bacterium]|nr:1-deoxy-D-xylulose-5-phosphate reductoisomerase [Chloroflexi bacterium CFX7]NUQ55293.1 1-deoxy-D-xylulose-5-phosphate reductoisomerase [Dehalococcoidia bacterium]RIL04142.1 MAG: 1-deoxy-D-xylulose-5-phosphate reductoisomerase [bacterium]
MIRAAAALQWTRATRYDGCVTPGVKRIAVLGSTGSIGRQALDVIRQLPGRFEVVALAAGRNVDELCRQVIEFSPAYVWSENDSLPLRDALAVTGTEWLPMAEMAAAPNVDLLLVATAGAAGLLPTLTALEAGRPVAIANKEALVMAGHLVRGAMARGGGDLRPVDSEHSAIWQCLWGEDGHEIRRILLTASGGAFRDFNRDQLAAVTAEQALNHPTWKMGPKITVDSATLMNKGMETIEAMWLFDVPMEKVEVITHRESIIHSLVEFSDGSVKAQLGLPDMRLPIQLALSYPERMPVPPAPPLDLASIGTLHFGAPDIRRFPCLSLAMAAGRSGGTMPAVMAAADEVAVANFLAGGLGFLDIPAVIEKVMDSHDPVSEPGLDAVLEADAWARKAASEASRAVMA